MFEVQIFTQSRDKKEFWQRKKKVSVAFPAQQLGPAGKEDAGQWCEAAAVANEGIGERCVYHI